MSRALAVGVLLMTGCGADKDAPGHDKSRPDIETDSDSDTDPGIDENPGNILILLIDDVGVDKMAPYGAYDMQPSTPHIDSLAERGVLFRRAYASPICSPTRASLLTGRYTARLGVGRTIWESSSLQLQNNQTLLPEMLSESRFDYTSAAVGKWHLAGLNSATSLDHPMVNGFDSYQGTLGNIADYYSWVLNDNGAAVQTEAYATTHQIDTTIALIDSLPEPWLIYVAFNAPHKPLHVPPVDLHSDPTLTLGDGDVRLFKAVVEAVDTEVGRLFSHMEGPLLDRTTILFLGDNGTGDFAVTAPFDPARSKNTVFEGGVHVPFIVAGPLVAHPGTESEAFVHVADVFHTVADLAEVDLSVGQLAGVATDGLSLLPYLANPDAPSAREFAFAEEFIPIGAGPYTQRSRMIREDRYKLIRVDGIDQPFREEIYEFVDGAVDEGPPLPQPYDSDQQAAYDRLVTELDRMDSDLVFDPRREDPL